jgi:hypothetical protein
MFLEPLQLVFLDGGSLCHGIAIFFVYILSLLTFPTSYLKYKIPGLSSKQYVL